MIRVALALLAVSLVACAPTPWRELQGSGKRIWLLSHDSTTVLRCYDWTPETSDYTGPVNAACQMLPVFGESAAVTHQR